MLPHAFRRIDGIQHVSSRQQGGLFTISPAVAVQLTPTFSVGAAFNIWPDLFGNGWEQECHGARRGTCGQWQPAGAVRLQGRINEDFAFKGFNVTPGFSGRSIRPSPWVGCFAVPSLPR